MIDQMARAIANLVIFLEYASPDILDEDAAIQAMEQLGGDLKLLDADALRTLSASFRSIAQNYEGEIRAFVADIPNAFGLEDLPENDD
jgi:hypothetical protein